MRIVFPDMHSRMPKSFAKALEHFGEVYLLGQSFKDIVSYGKKWTEEELKTSQTCKGVKNLKVIEQDEFFANPPDFLILSCYENQLDILNNMWLPYPTVRKKTNLVHYAGNTNVPYNWNHVDALLTSDLKTLSNASRHNKKSLFYFPWLDFDDEYSFKGTNLGNKINSYIVEYQPQFPEAHNIASKIKQLNSNYEFTFHENLPVEKISDVMNDSCATLHIKPLEGYGFSILESLGVGRPVILYKPYSIGKTYVDWCINDVTAIIFESLPELKERLQIFETDSNYREQMQRNAAKVSREKINLPKQKENLHKFLMDIKRGI